ncbi:oligosaccharide flippase family protein [Novosphingobium sp. KA1]|uniref:oligosaccharide flippase family protein n=1 Tax=Novosphingobium sp. (strain KA1) TaxID=164608 RepID=UPI001A8D2832|nr:oligosaccharide flippase family protein [Novosphingobium sp. KA1]QSR16204.1 hypothetical protein CA833_03170 [Novosphingobium sp. KA1]
MVTKGGRDVLALVRSWTAYAALPAAGIITAPILAHALGPQGRGQLAAILQPLALASAVAAVGVPSAVTYYIARSGPAEQIIRSALKIAAVMTLLVGAILIAYSARLAGEIGINRITMLAIWALFLPNALISIRRAHVQGLRQYFTLDLERVLIAGVRVVIIIGLWLAGVQSVTIFASAYMLPGLCAALMLRLPRNEKTTEPKEVITFTSQAFLKYSLLSSFGTIANAMSARLDQALMPAVVPVAELGYYSVAVAVAEISTILTLVAARNVLAEASAGWSVWKIAKHVLIGGIGQLVLILTISISLPYVMPIVFGADFGPAIGLIRILLLGTFVSYWANVVASYLTGRGLPGRGSSGQAAAAFLTAVLFWLLWHQMTALTAAWISVCSQVAALAVSVLFAGLLPLRRPKRAQPSDPRLARMPKPIMLFDPPRLWLLSTKLYQNGKPRSARIIKAYLFFIFRAVLPPEAVLRGKPELGHWAMNIVVHPNVTIGEDVMIWHGVTLSVSDSPQAPSRLVIGDRVVIGAGTVIVTPFHSGLTICNDVKIGANSVVSRSITEPGTYVGAPAKLVRSSAEA